MKLIEFLKVFLILPFVSTQSCLRKYHYWRPYFGEFSENDYLATTDVLGKRFYVAKVIPLTSKRSWTQPTQLMYDYTQFAWEDGKVFRQDRFIEILNVERPFLSRFSWISVHSAEDLININSRVCMVEGGIVNYRGRTVKAYIGRSGINGTFYIGPVYVHDWAMSSGFHFFTGWERRNRKRFYQVLTYLTK